MVNIKGLKNKLNWSTIRNIGIGAIGSWILNYLYTKLSIASNTDKGMNIIYVVFKGIIDSAVYSAVRMRQVPYARAIIAISLMALLISYKPMHQYILSTFSSQSGLKIINRIVHLIAIIYGIWVVLSFGFTSLFYFIAERQVTNLEIMAPNISEHKYLKLRSNLRSCQSYNDLTKYVYEIDRLSNKIQ